MTSPDYFATQAAAVEQLCNLLNGSDNADVHVQALMAIGNLASDSVDPAAALTKERLRAVNGLVTIAAFLFAPDAETVFYACGVARGAHTFRSGGGAGRGNQSHRFVTNTPPRVIPPSYYPHRGPVRQHSIS